MDPRTPVHSVEVLGVSSLPRAGEDPTSAAPGLAEPTSFAEVYDSYFPYIWRSVSRLGVPPAHVDDVVQEVFVVVHRKLARFEGRSSMKTWLYGIALRVARVHRVRARRARPAEAVDPDEVHAPEATHPDERAQAAEAARVVRALLDTMDDDQREVFVLAELEQLSAPEIAQILGVKLNTVYSRLRLGRAAFAEAAARHRARDGWRMP
jgi:RNA polymerase sigma-70 factor (ECF subfamily)